MIGMSRIEDRAATTEGDSGAQAPPTECAVAVVKGISIAPVKALGLVRPSTVEVGAAGIVGDRRFLLVDEDRRLVNGKRFGHLVRIVPSWDEGERRLALRFPSGEVVEGVADVGSATAFRHGSIEVAARDVVGPWAAAVSDYLRRRVALLWNDSPYPDRAVRGGSISLLSEESVRRLQREIGSREAIDSRRFRMTFDLAGASHPHAEDDWIGRRVRVGEAVLEPLGHVGRCVVTCRHPCTGERDLDTLAGLARYRRTGGSEPLAFGIYCQVLGGGRVELGSAVSVDDGARSRPGRTR